MEVDGVCRRSCRRREAEVMVKAEGNEEDEDGGCGERQQQQVSMFWETSGSPALCGPR